MSESEYKIIRPREPKPVKEPEVKVFDDGTYTSVRKGVRAGFAGALKGRFRRMFLSGAGRLFEDPIAIAERDEKETDRVPDSEEARDTSPYLLPLDTIAEEFDTPITDVPPDGGPGSSPRW